LELAALAAKEVIRLLAAIFFAMGVAEGALLTRQMQREEVLVAAHITVATLVAERQIFRAYSRLAIQTLAQTSFTLTKAQLSKILAIALMRLRFKTFLGMAALAEVVPLIVEWV